jgi:hypothetical protein
VQVLIRPSCVGEGFGVAVLVGVDVVVVGRGWPVVDLDAVGVTYLETTAVVLTEGFYKCTLVG